MNITIVGAGRAGSSFTMAFRKVGHQVRLIHHDEVARPGALGEPELVVLSVPDDAIATVAREIPVSDAYVVAHIAGARGLAELGAHVRVGFFHPLVALATPSAGAERLMGALFSVGGDAVIGDVVASLHGRAVRLSDDERVLYHAAATVAANHLVALLAHVEELASSVGLTLEDFLPLAQQALDDVSSLGVRRALTGPASRGDMATIDAHLEAISPTLRPAYVAMANAAFELAEARRLTSNV